MSRWSPSQDLLFNFEPSPGGKSKAALLSLGSIKYLEPEEWYNDEIIDIYSRMLQKKYSQSTTKVWVSNSYSTAGIKDWKYDRTKIKEDWPGNFLEYEYLLFPHNINKNHWILCVIDTGVGKTNSHPRVWILDSFTTSTSPYPQILKFFQDLILDMSKARSDFGSLKPAQFIPVHGPQQANSWDYGPYVLHHIDLFLNNPEASISNLESSNPIWPSFNHGYRHTVWEEIEVLRTKQLVGWAERIQFRDASLQQHQTSNESKTSTTSSPITKQSNLHQASSTGYFVPDRPSPNSLALPKNSQMEEEDSRGM